MSTCLMQGVRKGPISLQKHNRMRQDMDLGISKCLESQASMIRQILPNVTVTNTESHVNISQILKKKETTQ